MTMKDKVWKVHPYFLDGKLQNRFQRATNGNGHLKIAHWNAGARHWERKRTEIELLVGKIDPDLLYISEANLFTTTPAWEREIEGYSLLFPKSMDVDGHARILLLVKEGVDALLESIFIHELGKLQ